MSYSFRCVWIRLRSIDLVWVFVQFSHSHLFKGWPLGRWPKPNMEPSLLSLAPLDSACLPRLPLQNSPNPHRFFSGTRVDLSLVLASNSAPRSFWASQLIKRGRMWARVRRPDTWRDHHVRHPLWSTSHVGIHTWVNHCSPAVPNKPFGCRRVGGMLNS